MRGGYWLIQACQLAAIVLLFSAARPGDWWAWGSVIVGSIALNLAGYIEGRGYPWRAVPAQNT